MVVIEIKMTREEFENCADGNTEQAFIERFDLDNSSALYPNEYRVALIIED
jgi:hypothetical protein